MNEDNPIIPGRVVRMLAPRSHAVVWALHNDGYVTVQSVVPVSDIEPTEGYVPLTDVHADVYRQRNHARGEARELRRVLAAAREAVGEAWFAGDAPLAAAITRKTKALEEGAEQSESWRRSALAWQDWAKRLLYKLGRQPPYGMHGDEPARELIGQLATMAPPVPRCSRCGCFATRHEVDDEELRECVDCECSQFEATEGGDK